MKDGHDSLYIKCKRCGSIDTKQYSRILAHCNKCGSKFKLPINMILPKSSEDNYKLRILAVCKDKTGQIGCYHDVKEDCDHYCHRSEIIEQH